MRLELTGNGLPARRFSGFSTLLRFFSLLLLTTPFHGFRDEVYDFVGYFVHFQIFYHPSLRDHIIGLWGVGPCHSYIFFFVLVSLRMF